MSDHADPYDLLRRAEEIIRKSYPQGHGGPRERWLADFKKLPGSKLSKKVVRVLRDPHRRLRAAQEVVASLIEEGYLMVVRQMRGAPGRVQSYKQVRVSRKGREALRLREDVD